MRGRIRSRRIEGGRYVKLNCFLVYTMGVYGYCKLVGFVVNGYVVVSLNRLVRLRPTINVGVVDSTPLPLLL